MRPPPQEEQAVSATQIAVFSEPRVAAERSVFNSESFLGGELSPKAPSTGFTRVFSFAKL